MSYQLAG